MRTRTPKQGPRRPAEPVLSKASSQPQNQGTHSLLQLQSAIGNRAVQSLLNKPAAADVRLHTDAQAAASAEARGAAAYTEGRDIVFGAGRYQPESPAGQHLLMHELAHVAQQQNPGRHASSAELEHEADQVAADAVAGREARAHLAAPPARAQAKPAHWISGDVSVNPEAMTQITTKGGLFSGVDQGAVRVHNGKLEYDQNHTTPEDPFRWSRLKDVIDNGHLKIAGVSSGTQFKVRRENGAIIDSSIAAIKLEVGDLSVTGITLNHGGMSPDPVYDQIFYDSSVGLEALSHELFGHEWLALKNVPSIHPLPGSQEEKTKGTLLPQHQITDPFGAVFSGTVHDYILKYIESKSKVTVNSANGPLTVPASPTQNIGVEAVTSAFSALHSEASKGLKKNSYSGGVAQAWRTLCNNFDLMQTQAEAQKAGNWNLTYTKEVILMLSKMIFDSWTADQKAGFRILLADFTGSRKIGWSPNELSQKLEAAVGAAPPVAKFE